MWSVVDQRSLTWPADHFQIRQGVTALLRNLFMGSGPLIFHTPWAGREVEAAQSPELNKSDLLVMICIFYQKWRLARPETLLLFPGQFCLTQWEAGSYQVRPDPRTSEATRTLTSFLSSPVTAASDGCSVESFVQNLGVSFKWSRNIAFVWLIM